MHDIKCELTRKFASVLARKRGGGVSGNANFSCGPEGKIAFERDDVRCRWVGEKLRVELGQFRVRQKRQREFSRVCDRGVNGRELRMMSVQNRDDADDVATIQLETRVPDGDRNVAGLTCR